MIVKVNDNIGCM